MNENTLIRLKQYLDFKGITNRAFELQFGFSNGSFASQLKNGKTIGVDRLENILKEYADIDIEWLLTGRGAMIRNKESGAANVETSIIYKSDPKDLEIIKDKVRIIALQEDKIRMLEEKIAILPAVLGSARSADTTPDTGSQHPRK